MTNPSIPYFPEIAFAPVIRADVLPIAEREHAEVIQRALGRLNSYVEDFQAAIELCDLGDREPLYTKRGWKFIAGRDATMTIYHFAEALDGIRKALSQCPQLANSVDQNRLKSAGRILRSYFPDYKDARHAVAHISEKTKSPEMQEKHAFKGLPGVGAYDVVGSFMGRSFTNTFNGKLLQCELSLATLTNLRAMKSEIWEAFGVWKITPPWAQSA